MHLKPNRGSDILTTMNEWDFLVFGQHAIYYQHTPHLPFTVILGQRILPKHRDTTEAINHAKQLGPPIDQHT